MREHTGGIDTIVPLSPGAPAPGSKYDRLISRAREAHPPVTMVVHPCDESSLRGAIEAAELGIIEPVLVGPAAKITAVARERGIDIGKHKIVDVPHSDAAAAKAVELIKAGQGELLMKGSLHTDELMRAVTSSSTGLRTDRRISHVFVMDVPTYAETLFITDAAINIFPDLDVKRDIVQNAIDLFTQVGLGTPRVAILSAVETVTTKIPSTIEAAACARWRTAGRSRAVSLMVRWPSTMPLILRPRKSRASNLPSQAGLRSWSFPISRPAICWPRTSLSSQRRMLRDSFSALASPSF